MKYDTEKVNVDWSAPYIMQNVFACYNIMNIFNTLHFISYRCLFMQSIKFRNGNPVQLKKIGRNPPIILVHTQSGYARRRWKGFSSKETERVTNKKGCIWLQLQMCDVPLYTPSNIPNGPYCPLMASKVEKNDCPVRYPIGSRKSERSFQYSTPLSQLPCVQVSPGIWVVYTSPATSSLPCSRRRMSQL